MKKIIVFLILIFSELLSAGETRTLARSPRGLLMGDAYTSQATDDFTLFYNPALLARHAGFSFYPLNPSLTAPNALNDMERFTELGETPAEISAALMDYPVHIGLDYSPGFKLGHFGLSALVNYNTNFILQNQVTPVLDVDHRYDRGFIAGYAIPLKGSYHPERGGEQFSIGFSTKYIQRESIYGSYNLTGYSLLDAISQGEIDDVLNALGRIRGSGWGFDLGLDYINSQGPSSFAISLAVLDLYTILHTDANEDDLEVQEQNLAINLGMSWTADLGGGFDFTASLDLKNLEEASNQYAEKIFLGAEFGLTPALSIYAGVNSVDNYSYGLKASTGLLTLFAGFYTTETGEVLQQQDSNRAVIYLSFLDFKFEP